MSDAPVSRVLLRNVEREVVALEGKLCAARKRGFAADIKREELGHFEAMLAELEVTARELRDKIADVGAKRT